MAIARLVLGGEKQRALLAVLLLHAGEVVSADRLIDDLWGERSPAGGLNALQVHISRLRKALDGNGAGRPQSDEERDETPREGCSSRVGADICSRSGGASLTWTASGWWSRRGAVRWRRVTLQRASESLRVGLAMWRGPPLADFAYEAFAQAPIAQLEELRLGAVEDRVEADLALGRHEQLVGELAALVKQNPLRERLRMQLMLALYRCGRQAEALDVYQEYRRGLAEELGLDPSSRLRQLQTAILACDPSLELPLDEPAPAADAAPMSRPRRAGGNHRRLALGVLAMVGVAAAVVVALVSQGGGAAPLSVIAADSVGAISAPRGAITAEAPVGSSPWGVAVGQGSVWVTNYNDGTVSRIDPVTHAVVPIQVESTPTGIAVGADAVWVTNSYSGTVSRIDPADDSVVATSRSATVPPGWRSAMARCGSPTAATGRSARSTPSATTATTIPLGGATDVAVGEGAVWVSDAANGRVLRVDPQTNRVTGSINVGTGPSAITVGFGSVWVTNSLDGTISRINPQTNKVTAVLQVGSGPNAIAAGAGGVWVANELGGTVVRIDPATNAPARPITVGNSPRGAGGRGRARLGECGSVRHTRSDERPGPDPANEPERRASAGGHGVLHRGHGRGPELHLPDV